MTVIDRISAMSEQDRVALINDAIRRASPCIHRYGESPGLPSAPTWHIIGLETHQIDLRFSDGRSIKDLHNAYLGMVHQVETGIKNRIIVFTHDKLFPPFKIDNLDIEKRLYENCRINPYFDANIHERMLREHYSLEPYSVL